MTAAWTKIIQSLRGEMLNTRSVGVEEFVLCLDTERTILESSGLDLKAQQREGECPVWGPQNCFSALRR